MYLKRFILAALALLIFVSAVSAQETYFGKNKVRYKDFEWSYISDKHFDIYFYEDAYETAVFAAHVMESSYVEISNELKYEIQSPVPVFIYNSHNDFQQTNIIGSIIPEGVGGFTEAFKNRIVIPFSGSYEEFRHVLHHELTHAVVYDMVFGKSFSSLLSKGRLFNVPLWFAEGYAEYSSRHGWDYFSDMFVRDATINGYLTPPMYLGGYLAYKQGQAMVKYIADTYGEDKLGLLLKKGRITLSLGKAMKQVLGITEKEFWEDFSKEMKKRYWPDIAERKEANEIGKQLTKARKDGSYFNEKPTYHPHGDKLAFFTDRSDYTEIILIDPENGDKLKTIVKSERSGDLESLHSFVSGMSFSPSGENLVFVAKSNGKPTLMFYSLIKDNIYMKKEFNFYNIVSPAWSPDSTKIAFSALKGDKRDLYVYDIQSDKLMQLTNDKYDDKEPSWVKGKNQLVFSSDRPHPTSIKDKSRDDLYVNDGAYRPGGFEYGFYNLFKINLNESKVSPLFVGQGQNITPSVSPDGKKVAFISNRNGIDNIYIAYLDSTNESSVFPVTDILTGIRSLSWSPDGSKLAFSAFNQGGFDIFVLEDIKPVGENNVLAFTNYFQGAYDLLESQELAESDSSSADTSLMNEELHPKLAQIAADYQTYELDSTDVAQLAEAAESDTTFIEGSTTGEETETKAPEDEQAEEDTTSTSGPETGITDEGFVYVSEKDSAPVDSLFIDVPGGIEDDTTYHVKPEPAEIFDDRSGPGMDGEFDVKDYSSKLSLDYFNAYGGYDTFYGLRGQSFFVLSDYLGNHQIYIITDLVNTIDQSNIYVQYMYNKHRTKYGFGLFHTKYYFEDNLNYLFSDRVYGASAYISYPFSTFRRVDFELAHIFIDREYLDFYDPRSKENTKVTTASLSYVADNVVWGITGPVNGRRAKLTVQSAINFFDSNDLSFTAAEFDYRKYWHIKKTASFAFRISGGASFGETPKQYYLGGTTNWIGSRDYSDDVYELENLHFSRVITPLRGEDYYGIVGNRFGLINTELRFPLIDYFIMRYPLPLALTRIQGAIFADVGAAWDNDNFKGASSNDGDWRLQNIKVGFGTGLRINLGIFLLRYDVAWQTDLNDVSDRAHHYISFGADF